MRLSFFLLILIRFLPLRAETLESHFLYLTSRAQTGGEIETLRTAYSRLKVADMACEIQMQEQQVPVACYEKLFLERKYAIDAESTDRIERVHRLDNLCLRAADRLQLGTSEATFVSPVCAKRIREVHAIQAYRREEPPSWSEN